MNTTRTLLLAAALGLSLPALADPPDFAPAHGYRAQHRYVYYPTRQIYWAPDSRLWFWLDGGNWRFGASLPVFYQQYTTGGVSIELSSDRPYTEHRYVVEHYGGGDRHHRSGGRHDDRGDHGHPGRGKHGRD